VLVEWVAAGLVAGELLATGSWPGGGARVAAALLPVACLLWTIAARRVSPAAVTAAVAVTAGIGGALLVARAVAMPGDVDHVGRLALPMRTRVVGRVAAWPVADARRTIVLLDVTRVGERPRTWGRVRLRVRGPVELARGEVIAVETTLRRVRNFENPGRFDVEGLLARQGVHVVASVWDAAAIDRLAHAPGAIWMRGLDRWRAAVRTALDAVGDPDVAAVLRALVLGDESAVASDLRTAFSRAGVVHVLSVSGLHVGIVTATTAALLAWLLGRSEVALLYADRRKVAAAGGLVAAGLYGALTGFALATVRSVLMAGVVVAAIALDRTATPGRALALAAVLLVTTQPGAPADISFQLSFVSVAALLVGAGRSDPADRRRWPRVRRAVRAAGAAWLGTAPLTAFHFHQVSLVSVLANPVVIPLFEGVALLPALVGALVAPTSPAFASVVMAIAAVPVGVGVLVVRWVGGWSWAAVEVPLPSVVELALLYAVLAGWCCRRMAGGRLAMGLGLAALALDAAGWTYVRMGSVPRATFLDVGQGDAAIVELAGGRVLVIDAGGFPGSDFDTGAAIVEPALRARKIQRVDAVVMSHAHPDHATGLAHLVRAFAPRELWWSGLGGVGAAWDALVLALRDTGTPVRILRAGATIPDFPEVDVVHPPAGWTAASLNEGSLVLRVRVGAAAVLFTGDAERAAEDAMLARPATLGAAVLKVPHHGSRTSSAWPFVAAVAPTAAVASLGAENRFGHPAPEVTARYARAGVGLYRTDRCGAVTVTPTRDGLRIGTGRPGCGNAPPAAVRTRSPP
jgi:competence protein ComEC